VKPIFIVAAWLFVGALSSQEQVGTVTGGPLTVAGVPIYGIAEDGGLSWYFHRGAHDGSFNWANQGRGIPVGNGWNEGLRVFKGDPGGNDGVIYRIDSRGDLYWYKHLGHATGSATWIEGKKVGNGWQVARQAFGAGDGIVYMVHENGDLLWYRHLGYEDGSETWANGGTGKKVGVGWSGMRIVFAGGDGAIYAIDAKGDMYWYRHDGRFDGSFTWANGASGVKIGNGWNDAASAFSGGGGLIYALKRNGNLYWYNHTGYATGAATWTPPGTGNRIGTGWAALVRIF